VRRLAALGGAAGLLAASLALAQSAAPPSPPAAVPALPPAKEEKLPGPEVPQPIAFSHRVHAQAARLDCLDCHEGAAKGDSATIPQAAACLVCHASIRADSPEVARIADAAGRGAKVSWARVYRIPDFVFFGHREHLAARVACAECHGDVAARDALRKEVSTGMNACLACHRQRGAPLHCAACHQLGH
jgi:hypothetical protein